MSFTWSTSGYPALRRRRVRERVRNGGHRVPEAIVRRRYARSLSNFFNLYRPFADSWLLLDNAGPWEHLRRKYENDILDEG